MPGQTVTLEEALPRSHYFVTVSRGSGMKTVAIRSGLAHFALALLPLFLVVGLGSTLYLVFHDDLMGSLMARQTAMQYAYEDKIEGLRQELERQSAQVGAERARVDSTMHDLFSREATLENPRRRRGGPRDPERFLAGTRACLAASHSGPCPAGSDRPVGLRADASVRRREAAPLERTSDPRTGRTLRGSRIADGRCHGAARRQARGRRDVA